jgi:hypothetical protein
LVKSLIISSVTHAAPSSRRGTMSIRDGTCAGNDLQ